MNTRMKNREPRIRVFLLLNESWGTDVKEIYFDNSATTRCSDAVAAEMVKVMTEDYGNPSSMHMKGVEAERYVRQARETLASILKVSEKEIYFTSGGTESDNMAIIGTALANCRAGKHVITTAVEHPAVLNSMRLLEEEGFTVTYLPVDHAGCVSLDALRAAMTPQTILVSVMLVNNEIGSIQPVAEVSAIAKAVNPSCLVHVDAVQGFGKLQVYPRRMGIDLLSASGHKIHGPKGIGFLYAQEKAKLKPIVFGGGQQKNMRSGTENVPGIAGLALAAKECYTDLAKKQEYLYDLRDAFMEGVRRLEGTTVNGPQAREGAPHIVSVSFSGIRSEVLLHTLEARKIYVSSGSACASNKPGISGTLKSIGLDRTLLDATLRFSFSVYNTQEEVRYCLEALGEALPVLRRYARH